MRRGTCPKCAGDEIYAAATGLALGDTIWPSIRMHIEPGFRGIRHQKLTEGLWQCVCAQCGYLEFYLLDAEAIAFVRERWVRVPPPAAD